MSELLWTDQPRGLLIELRHLVADRAAGEVDLVAGFLAKRDAAEKQYQEAQAEASARHEKDRADTEVEYTALREAIVAQFQSDHTATEEHYDLVRSEIAARFGEAETTEKKHAQDARWQANAVFEATKVAIDARLKEVQTQLEARQQEIAVMRREAVDLLRRRRQWHETLEARQPTVTLSPDDPLTRSRDLVESARAQLLAVHRQTSSRLFEGLSPPGIVLAICMATTLAAGLAAGGHGWVWLPAGLVAGVGLAAGLLAWLYFASRRQSAQAYWEIRRTWAEAELACAAASQAVEVDSKRKTAQRTAELDSELREADRAFYQAAAELENRRQQALRQSAEEFAAIRSATTARHNGERCELEERYAQRLVEIDALYEGESSAMAHGYRRTTSNRESRFHQDWDAMAARWLDGLDRFGSAAEEMSRSCVRLFPGWEVLARGPWTPPAAVPRGVPLGKLEVRLEDVEGGIPKDFRLAPARTKFSLPVVFPFRDHSLAMLRASGDGRSRAVEAIQAVMLRMLTALPPGKVRFLILDPVGLGENFSAFMHLADFNEQLVASRIWTEGGHIERRLAELTEHMENVLQVYLRNEFQSLQEYNESAGELAEPYRVLVVANFPAGFSELSARRLVSIAASGARCGVYTLLSLDERLPVPREISLAELRRHAIDLAWNGERFVWEHPELGSLPVVLDAPPGPEAFTEIVRRVGHLARDADRIELPFDWVVPEESQWWTADARQGIDVPLGRAGVTKLQHLQLGRGTSQHVLIAGKTGSGKSTLLHVLIVNLAMRYSPDEIELYLVDFKKGVEFKAYAEAELPHARVIAIESEREFGLSVLERLDLELKRRGDLFRQRGVQDLPAYRAAEPGAKLPRAMLIVDEFQELFVEDDRIAQSAALLLDRLVRQGRAFGIHVLLGSQTLAGAYSIPRSTIGQMAVRVALQCSEADAHLILSEENTAARLLTRPGEAIYNDANGLYEGNHPFQVVWLSEDERERHLKRLRDWARTKRGAGPAPIVFEGNLPADPSRNEPLAGLLAASSWPVSCQAPKAWIGSPVAIQDPTVAVLARQAGANLLVVGHQEDSALGILGTGLVSLAAQHPPGVAEGAEGSVPGARFYVLDGTRADAPQAGFWPRVAEAVPHAVKVVGPRQAAGAIAEVAQELARREQTGEEDGPPVYLIVYDLARFRDLRKGEDDFGFARSDENAPPNPARQFRTILHDGPALGIHALVWGDSYNTVTRVLDRQGLEDMELRVAFRMNTADSSSLIDSPVAGQLGVHRAIFDDEGEGRLEKFRPYGPPSAEWLAWVHRQLGCRR